MLLYQSCQIPITCNHQAVIIMHLPFVSVVIPALNCEHEVNDCILALRSQDYPAEMFEIIVADNGSTDDTVEQLHKLNVKTVIQQERGRSRALNAGLEQVTGEIVLTTDMGCRPHSDWISNVVRCFSDPTVGCVAGDIHMIMKGSNIALRFQERNHYMSPMHAYSRRKLPFLPFADGANACFRRSIFDEIGNFDESFFKAADVEICYRLLVLTNYKIVFCSHCTVSEAGEENLYSLLKQRFRIGMGTHLLRIKYPLFFKINETNNPLKHFFWKLHYSSKLFIRLISDISNKENISLEDKFVRILMSLSQKIGYTYESFVINKLPTLPTPIDQELALIFINKFNHLHTRIVMCNCTDE